jgi:hypothetical protein
MNVRHELPTTGVLTGKPNYPATFFACARNFAHRFLAALPILPLAAADKTRFFTALSSLFVELPRAFIAPRITFSTFWRTEN